MKPLLLLPVVVWLSACTSVPPPPMNTETPVLGWHDLVSVLPANSRDFYAETFGWTFRETRAGSQWQARTGEGVPVAGLIRYTGSRRDSRSAVWLTTLAVPDLDKALASVADAGGEVRSPARSLTGGARAAVIAGPDGAVLQLREDARKGGKNDSPWIWHELVTADPEAAADWMARVFDLTVRRDEGTNRLLLESDGDAIASVSQNPFEEAPDQWIPVLAVADLDGVLESVESLGGQVVMPPDSRRQNGRLALITDPQHAPLVLQQVEVSE